MQCDIYYLEYFDIHPYVTCGDINSSVSRNLFYGAFGLAEKNMEAEHIFLSKYA